MALAGAALLAVVSLQGCAPGAAASFPPVIDVEGGQISGTVGEADGVAVYMGIPYAAAPVGELRWKAPQPVAAWDGVRDCSAPGYASVQDKMQEGTFYWKEFYQGGDPDMSEDCLYLNVWTPAAGDAEAQLPVMLWIHGGGFNHGYGHEIEFDGTAYAERGVILVTINYRVGMCGFLSHPLLTAENGGKGSGNYGLQDQLAAVKWVKRNIAAFGGDPGNITIFGQSAGAGSVQSLISSPLAQGYVAKAIIQSGGGLGGIIAPRSLEEAEQMGKAMWDAAGVTTLEQMRAYPVEKLDEVMTNYLKTSGQNTGLLAYCPCVDGQLLTATYDETAQAAQQLDIPYMIGYTTEDIAPEVMRKAALDWAALLEAQGRQPAYVYSFSHDLPGEDMPEGGMPGAFHSSELWYTFGTLGRCWRPMEQADYDLSERMVGHWTNFASTGNPNGDGLPEWQPCTSATGNHIEELK